jgi:hypothetical protein
LAVPGVLAAGRLDVRLGDPGVLRAVLCGGLYLCTVTMVGFGLGAIVRHSAVRSRPCSP